MQGSTHAQMCLEVCQSGVKPYTHKKKQCLWHASEPKRSTRAACTRFHDQRKSPAEQHRRCRQMHETTLAESRSSSNAVGRPTRPARAAPAPPAPAPARRPGCRVTARLRAEGRYCCSSAYERRMRPAPAPPAERQCADQAARSQPGWRVVGRKCCIRKRLTAKGWNQGELKAAAHQGRRASVTLTTH